MGDTQVELTYIIKDPSTKVLRSRLHILYPSVNYRVSFSRGVPSFLLCAPCFSLTFSYTALSCIEEAGQMIYDCSLWPGLLEVEHGEISFQ